MVRSGKPPNPTSTSLRKTEQQPEHTMGLFARCWIGRCQWNPKGHHPTRDAGQALRCGLGVSKRSASALTQTSIDPATDRLRDGVGYPWCHAARPWSSTLAAFEIDPGMRCR
jgi:hypothetical protein